MSDQDEVLPKDPMTRRQALVYAAGTVAAGFTKPGVLSPSPEVVPMDVEPLSFPWQTSDPFLFCAYHLDAYPKGNSQQGPAVSLSGRAMGRDFAGIDGWRMYHGDVVPGFPRHPHRGFETITVVNQGLVDHSDSLGATARYGKGDVQWLTAGGGIQHAEMFPLTQADHDNPLELFQIWLNFPRKNKMVQPHFKMLWAPQVPRVIYTDADKRNVELTLVAGSYQGKAPPAPPPNSWASDPNADVMVWTLTMQPNATFALPEVKEGIARSLYFYEGDSLHVAGKSIAVNHRVILKDHKAVVLKAGAQGAKLLLLGGRPIKEPVAHHGPFVMNTREELVAAFSDYQATQFGGWKWERNDPVHDATQGRFAQHPDGRTERPT